MENQNEPRKDKNLVAARATKPSLKPSESLDEMARFYIEGIKMSVINGREPKTPWKDVPEIVAAANGEQTGEKRKWIQSMIMIGYNDTWEDLYADHIKELTNCIGYTKQNSTDWHQAHLNLQWWKDAGVRTFIKRCGAEAEPEELVSDTLPSCFIDRYENEYDSPYDDRQSPPADANELGE